MAMISIVCLEVFFFITGVTTDSFYFASSPQNQDVEEGQPFRLECAVTPDRDIHYSWVLNDRPIQLDNRRQLESGSHLQVNHADRDLDKGRYQCRALNRTSKFSSASREAKVDVYWMSPNVRIELVRPSRREDIKLGSEALLRCAVDASPPVKASNIKWYYNGNWKLPTNTEIQGDGSLRISAVAPGHGGVYHCRVIHSAGRVDSRPPYILALPPGDGQIRVNYNQTEFNKFLKRGERLELHCPRAENLPNAVAAWGYMSRLGDSYQASSNLKDVQLINNDWTLQINNFQDSHVNFYTCEISGPNTPPVDRPFFIFQVEIAAIYNVKRDQFSPHLPNKQPYTVRMGEDASLKFYIDLIPSNSFLINEIPNPPPSIQWYGPNSREIPTWDGQSPNPPRIHALHGRHLVISKITESDSGNYQISVSNMAGRKSMKFDIIATFPPEFSDDREMQNIEIDEDEPVTLRCGIIKRSPEPSSHVYWEKSKVRLSQFMPDMRIEKNGTEIRIARAKPEHSGNYQCFVVTDGYEDKFSSVHRKLTVKGKLQFIRKLEEKFIELNTQGRVPCSARGFGSIRTIWMRKQPGTDRLVPIPTSKHQIENGILIFQYVQKSDAGEYVCIAKSNYRDREINMTVKVIVGESPRISYLSPNETIKEGDRLVLNCRASGDPQPLVSWMIKKGDQIKPLIYGKTPDPGSRDMQDLPTSLQRPGAKSSFDPGVRDNSQDYYSNEKQRREVLKNGTLIIREAHLTDEAEYICIAANPHALNNRQGVHVRVLTSDEFSRMRHGADGPSGVIKTVMIVVSCAVAYLGLIIGLTVFCSMRLIRNRRHRAQMTKPQENGHLLNPVNGNLQMGSGGPGTVNGSHVSPLAAGYLAPSVAPLSSTTTGSYMGTNNGMLMSAAESQHLMSAPPPTPLDSRSHLSGISSGNSASLYTRSQLSGASTSGMAGAGSNVGPIVDRFNYPRQALQTEGMLGKCEFGDVFLARARSIQDGEPQSLVVVKSLLSRDPAHVHEFQRQFDLFAKLDHDYIVKLLGTCAEVEPYFMILEYCEWGDLKQFLRCMRQEKSNFKIPPLTQAQKITMCSQIAMGMEHLSNLRCVHKDLAARNILLTQDMDLKIAHLGLCRDVYASEYCVIRDRLVPLRWMAPEAITHDAYSTKTDIWAYGILVCEVFSLAELPYARTSDRDLLQAAQNGALKPEVPPECPPELAGLLHRCWSDQPHQRPGFPEISVIVGDLTVEAGI